MAKISLRKETPLIQIIDYPILPLDRIKYPLTIIEFIFGFIACGFLIFPGVSGSAFLLAIGIYPLIISSVSTFNFQILLPFAIGMLLSIATMPRLISNLYSKYGEPILIFFGLCSYSG